MQSESSNPFTGLTEAEVQASRLQFGENVLTPPQRDSLWQQLRGVLGHWISVSMGVLCVGSIVAACLLADSMGGAIWMTPTVMLLAWLLMVLVGFFGGYRDALFRILLTAFVLSIGIAVYEYEWGGAALLSFLEPLGIIVALLLATGVAFVLERRNEKTFQSLNRVNDESRVKVLREGSVRLIARREVVVDDIVLLEMGDEVPADCELVDSLHLLVDESSLTGEPQCAKSARPEQFDAEATYPSNYILKGTTVLEGYCKARVLRVGDATESGKVFEAAQVSEGVPTPLDAKLNRLAHLITRISYLLALLVVVGRLFSLFVGANAHFHTSEDWLQLVSYLLNTLMIAVTLIVVAVPEGLPMSVMLSLAFSMRKLMKENTLPRTLHACETMGAVTVICTDKTGTLTQNRMQVTEARLNTTDDRLVAEMIAANSTANLDLQTGGCVQVVGNPTEGALLLWLNAQGHSYQSMRRASTLLDRWPFTTERKFMASLVRSDVTGQRMLYVKGAPEIVLSFCNVSEQTRQEQLDCLLQYQNKGMRTLALAYKQVDSADTGDGLSSDHLAGLQYVGFLAISDPIREQVPEAMSRCASAGIQVKIVTGDTSATAMEIGRQIGLWTAEDGPDQLMTGVEFAALRDEEIISRLTTLKILSRARPSDKERLVRLLRQMGNVVATTGDGTNDAPALNAANVGLSMGDGTAVAKEASDMTILDNSFSTIGNAVMWGRSLYKNIQRFIMFQMTINVVACCIVLLGAFLDTTSPLTVTQMLWVNLIMDTFAAISLASLPPEPKVMQEVPRALNAHIINRPMAWSILGVGGLFTLLLLFVLLRMQYANISSMSDLWTAPWDMYDGLSSYELSLFFTLFVFLQFWNMFNAKAFLTGRSAFAALDKCKGFVLIAAIILLGQVVIVELAGKMFNVTHIHLVDWLTMFLLTSVVLWVGEFIRLIKRTL